MKKKAKFKLFKHLTSQATNVINRFNNFFNRESFDQIIELGTGTGVFSSYLSFYTFMNEAEFHTFDIKESEFDDKIQKLGGNVYKCDIMKNEQLIKELIIAKDKRTLLLCDNGNKIEEVKMFSQYLKSKDIIMAHDYFYKKGENLPWSCEITDKDISEVMINNNLEYIYKSTFNSIFWCCLLKK